MIDKKQIKSFIKEGVVPGCSVCVLNKDKTENYSFGYYDDNKNKKVKNSTVYDLASLTKLYTTAIILRLHEKGVLSINNKCSLFLDVFKDSELTIFDLLTHKANFGIFLADYRKDKENFSENVFLIKPKQKSSTSPYYENINFLYLGKIIEKTTDHSLKGAFENLFKELNLNNTFVGCNLKRTECPPTELINGELLKNITHDESARMLGGIAGNAGVFATAEDVAKFGLLWINNKIISKELTQQVFTNHFKRSCEGQGIGWFNRLRTKNKIFENIFYHTGFTGTILAINIKSKTIYSLLTNRTLYGRDNIAYKKLWNVLLHKELEKGGYINDEEAILYI